MKSFPEYIAKQILNYLDECHLVGEYQHILETVSSLIPSPFRGIDKKAADEDLKKIVKSNWDTMPVDKKIKILKDLGDLGNFFANLIIQKRDELEKKYPFLFKNPVENNMQKDENKIVEDKKNEIFEDKKTSEDEVIEGMFGRKEKEEEKEKIESKPEKSKSKILKLKEDAYNIPIGVKSSKIDSYEYKDLISDLSHETDEFSIYRDYSGKEENKINDPAQPSDYITDKTSYDPTIGQKPKGINDKKIMRKNEI